MNIFIKTEEGDLEINNSFIAVPEFKKLWDRDNSKNKETAISEFMYIYQKNYPKSPYQQYDENIKEERVINDYIEDPEWKPDEFVKLAEKRYVDEFLHSPAIRFANSIKIGLDKISRYIIETEIDSKNLSKILSAISKGEETLDRFNKVQRIAEEQLESEKKKRRGSVAPSKTLN